MATWASDSSLLPSTLDTESFYIRKPINWILYNRLEKQKLLSGWFTHRGWWQCCISKKWFGEGTQLQDTKSNIYCCKHFWLVISQLDLCQEGGQSVKCLLLFLVLAENSARFQVVHITHSYSSRPFLYALANIASQLLVGCVAIRLPDLLCNKVLAKVQQINAYQVMYVGMTYPAGRTSLSPWCTFMAHGRMATWTEPDVGWVVTQETQNPST